MSADARRRGILAFGAGQVALLVPLLALERRMKRAGGPGIIPFELAGSPERSRKIMDRWGAEGQAAARLSLLLDYPYLVTYSGLQVAATRASSKALRRRGASALARAGRVIGATQLAAGMFDAAENTALLGILAGRNGRLPALARAFASAKFALLGLGWGYAALGLASHLTKR
ncbi:MAG: hypothetical protein ACJ76S_06945 [Solirubrobacteraceae bacterium]